MNSLPAILVSLLLAGCEAPGQPSTPAQPAAPATQAGATVDPAHLDAVLESFVRDGKVVGVSALVHQHGREVYSGAFGQADREAGRAMARDTLVQVWSMTKPVTGVVLMSLYEEGRFALDDPLSMYLPEYAGVQVFDGVDADGRERLRPPRRPILVLDILRHTAGFSSESDRSPLRQRYMDADLSDRSRTLAEFSETLARIPLAFDPGGQWLYGPAVDVQARLAESLAGKPYAQLLRERVLDPLGMRDTAYHVEESRRRRLAATYEYADGTLSRVPASGLMEVPLEPPVLSPGGYGLVSTLEDYLRFARMLLGGGEVDGVRVLKPATVALMATDLLAPAITERSWLPSKGQVGFGIDVAVRHSPPADAGESSGAVGEFFWDGYANTLFWVDPRNELVAVLFTQYVPPSGHDLHTRFRDAVYRDFADARAPQPQEAGAAAP